MQKWIHFISVAIMGIFLSGCASFQGNRLKPVSKFPEIQNKQTLDVDFSTSFTINDGRVQAGHEVTRDSFEKRCIKRLKRSGLFKAVSADFPDSDFKLKVHLHDEGKGSFVMAFLTGLSFYLIPSHATDTYKLRAVLYDREKKKRFEIKLEDSITQWQHISLLLLLPFKSTIMESIKCQNKLFDNMASELGKSGILK